jgi:endoglucanase
MPGLPQAQLVDEMKFLPTLVTCIGFAISGLAASTIPGPMQLGRGINLGNFLEVPNRAGVWGTEINPKYIPIVSVAGFQTIRVPISWPHHVTPQPTYTIDPSFFKSVDAVVAQAHQYHLKIILDYHNDQDLMDHPDVYSGRFLSIWKQVAEHYQKEPSTVLFELLNEPRDSMGAARWNDLIACTLPLIRPTNPDRVIVVGPIGANKIANLPGLILPDDPNLLVTVHYYLPIEFTHQGTEWIPRFANLRDIPWKGAPADEAAISTAFDQAAEWGRTHKRPIFLGEFGTYGKVDMASRVRWTSFVARQAEQHGFPWAYWEFCAGFGAFDPIAQAWRPPLLKALLPP